MLHSIERYLSVRIFVCSIGHCFIESILLAVFQDCTIVETFNCVALSENHLLITELHHETQVKLLNQIQPSPD